MSCRRHSPSSERGLVLVSSLLLLVVVTILAIGLFRSFGMDEKIASNTREKQRALQAAMSAEQYAEWWLLNGTLSGTTNCTTSVVAPQGQICTNVLSNSNVPLVPWSAQVTYTPPNMTVTHTSAAGTYYTSPAYYISYLGVGTAANGSPGYVYQIDAVGYGGSPSTAAVVESTFIVQTTSTTCRDCP